jgi:hypothetical protein
MYDDFKNSDGLILVGGHRFHPRTHLCINLRNGCDCLRHINDVLSDAPYAKRGDLNIACYGGLTDIELSSLQAAYAARLKAFEVAA